MWKDAQKELYGFDTYENEHGFILYQSYDDGSCYIKLIYCKPESRNKGNIFNLYKNFCLEVKPTLISGTVDVNGKDPEKNLLLYLNMGAKIKNINGLSIVFVLEPIKE